MPDALPLPRLDGVLNFRELGGLTGADGATVRHGQIYRSGHLAEATDEDLGALASLGIATIVDFRLEIDLVGDGGPDRVPAGARHVSLPVTDPGGGGAEIREVFMSGDADLIDQRFGDGRAHHMAVEGAVAQALDPQKQAVYRTFLRHVLDDSARPLLFHCSAGKDRAGWAATLIAMALGVSDDEIVEHYLLSNVYRDPEERRAHYEARGIDVGALMPFLAVHEDYLRAALAAVDDGWTSRQEYLEAAVGLTRDDVERLRGALLR